MKSHIASMAGCRLPYLTLGKRGWNIKCLDACVVFVLKMLNYASESSVGGTILLEIEKKGEMENGTEYCRKVP